MPQIVRDCAAAGVKGAIVISAGFKEIGERGRRAGEGGRRSARRDADHRTELRRRDAAAHRLERDLREPLALPGNIGFISQSGALCTAILDWSLTNQLGFSAFVSIGSMLDVNWGDLIYHLGDDPHTRSILLYMESIGDARSFLSAARGSCPNETDHRRSKSAAPRRRRKRRPRTPARSPGATKSAMLRSGEPVSCASIRSRSCSTSRNC